jgi:hypothetical protein
MELALALASMLLYESFGGFSFADDKIDGFPEDENDEKLGNSLFGVDLTEVLEIGVHTFGG